jgi:AcrR family transcriptional regulator
VNKPIPTRRPVAPETLEPIVAAARKCFAEVGVARTRMEDVASRASMSRQGVYRYVSGRDDLVALAIMQRCREFGDELMHGTEKNPADVVEAMVDLILRMVKLARGDQEFAYLAEATPRIRLNMLLTSDSSPMHGLVSDCFEPLLTQAESENRLRTDVTRREMTQWIQGVLTVMTARPDLDVSEQRRYAREFAVRGLLI